MLLSVFPSYFIRLYAFSGIFYAVFLFSIRFYAFPAGSLGPSYPAGSLGRSYLIGSLVSGRTPRSLVSARIPDPKYSRIHISFGGAVPAATGTIFAAKNRSWIWGGVPRPKLLVFLKVKTFFYFIILCFNFHHFKMSFLGCFDSFETSCKK